MKHRSFEEVLEAKRTRIVATLGPVSESPEMIRELALRGVNVFRLNFSHGEHEKKAGLIRIIRALGEELQIPLGILADLSGPKIRLGKVPGDAVAVRKGEEVRITAESGVMEERRFSVNVQAIHELIEPGRFILLDDGTITLRVDRTEGLDVVCVATEDCTIKSRKGVNLPGTRLPIPALTEKDQVDLDFALSHNVDFVALSFVRSAQDVLLTKEIMAEKGYEHIPLIAKIEKSEAIDQLDAILQYADGAMVARGDLGVEIPVEEVPAAQRRIIRKCNLLGKPVITATQMLNTMITEPMPTRAEVTDIYNAILQGTDAVMLSGETAMGAFPLKAVEMMSRIIAEADEDLSWQMEPDHHRPLNVKLDVPEAICQAAVNLAHDLHLDAIICATSSGATAVRLSRFRPKCPLIAFSTSARVMRKLSLYWGIEARFQREVWESETELGDNSAIMNLMLQTARDSQLIKKGMNVVLVAGVPLGVQGSTNFAQVIKV
jgi:pyruvate kinase